MNNSSQSRRNSGVIWRMRRQCIPGSFFSAYTKEPGDEAMSTLTPSFSFSILTFFRATVLPVFLSLALCTSLYNQTTYSIPHCSAWSVYFSYPNVPWPILASFSYLVTSGQYGKVSWRRDDGPAAAGADALIFITCHQIQRRYDTSVAICCN